MPTYSLWRDKSLAVLGGGNMAEALLRGALAANLLAGAQIHLYDPLPARREIFRNLGCQTVDRTDALPNADVLLLATKPQTLAEAVQALPPGRAPLVISIAAGIGTAALAGMFPENTRIIRVMPNTPLLVGAGMSALAKGAAADAADLALAGELFAAGGRAVVVPEDLMDAVTALSGSGPAYLFRFAEALIEGGKAIGLPEDLARTLTINTLLGAAKMLLENPDALLLRERVTSPGGTTAAALAVLNEGGFMELTARALAAARERGQELGRR